MSSSAVVLADIPEAPFKVGGLVYVNSVFVGGRAAMSENMVGERYGQIWPSSVEIAIHEISCRHGKWVLSFEEFPGLVFDAKAFLAA